MHPSRLLALAVFAAALDACTCANTVENQRFACRDTSECAPGNVCRGGECRKDDIPTEQCFPPEEPRPCLVDGCAQVCGDDGLFQGCAPSAGPGLDSNPLHCGACGTACATRLTELGCAGGQCTCAVDGDCGAGEACRQGGLCTVDNGTDPCARVRCGAGQVCRAGACAAVPCDPGCEPGEVCEAATQLCRPIDQCHLPVACNDGGVCEGPLKPDGEPCDDGQACTFGDTCAAGACAGSVYTCPAPDQCQLTVACLGDGGCGVTAQPDGTPCGDGVACTHTDQCLGGACAGAAYACTAGPCTDATCLGDGGCDYTPRSIGAACDDSAACTYADRCSDAGTCTGTLYSCPTPTFCQQAVACAGDGGCVVTNKTNGTTCDDGNACTGTDVCSNGTCAGAPPTSYQNLDGDGRGNSSVTQTVCPVPGGYVLTGGDCNDNNANLYQSVSAAKDADQDSFTATTTLASTCVGATAAGSGGRTYYADADGGHTWIATASATLDCNDADNTVLGAPTWYRDADGDGRGTSGTTTSACTQPGGYVASSTDCNDGSANVYQTVANLRDDGDQDGYSNSGAASRCVGTTATVGTRTYYRATDGGYPFTTSYLGTDCNTSNGGLFTTVPVLVVVDNDQDGYPPNNTQTTPCAGATSTVGGRTYYANGAGGFWMPVGDCINKNGGGTQCQFPFDPDDADSGVP